MSSKSATRKCTMCGNIARQLVSEEEITSSYDPETGEFFTCLYDATWEICKEINENDKADQFIFYKNGQCVGKFRELN